MNPKRPEPGRALLSIIASGALNNSNGDVAAAKEYIENLFAESYFNSTVEEAMFAKILLFASVDILAPQYWKDHKKSVLSHSPAKAKGKNAPNAAETGHRV